ncbi:hypothetical protein C7S18_13590 [Ahniella affigens]|uniref:Alginate export domain-containing protein n=1 Tax=Ahniella affigens TaxID=2021234 RepID=A0A2P1PTL4_9GAMM|nr:alginate export family protein [Ahniella affigens]AVP98162.1 hypothetical protein C7S18_13590 [Ahniella affigens]
MIRKTALCIGLTLAIASVTGHAQTAPVAPPSNPWAFSFGTFSLDSRVRYESVDDGGFAETSDALTWRNRLGFRTRAWHGFSAFVEVEDVRALGDDYPTAAAPGNTQPPISDPEGTEWNQALIAYDSGSGVKVQLGRQRLLFDNQRFFGNVGWRQNEQTFDAAVVNWTLPNKGVLDVVWLDGVHRIFGHSHPNTLLREWDLQAPLIHYTQPVSNGSVSAYAYFVENETQPLSSARTVGVRYSGKCPAFASWQWSGTAEYARQSDWADAVDRPDQDYRLLEAGLISAKAHSFKLGWEVLSGDGRFAFQTPFATLHAFNGWADRFLTTPANGLDDLYLSWSGPCHKLTCTVAWHRFESDRLNLDLGKELDVSASYAFTPKLSGIAKYAVFQDADTLADVSKFWLGLEYKR